MAKLTLLQLNDLHGYVQPHPELVRVAGEWQFMELGGLARIAALFGQVRKETDGAVIALDNGDTFHGTRLAVASRGHALLEPINSLGLDAMTLHWEFAYTPAGVLELAAGLNHPMLAANCFQQEDGELFLQPWTMLERAGLRVAVIGLACPIIDKVMPPEFSAGVRFTIGNEEMPRWVAAAREDGADLVVLLSHLGFPQDVKLVNEVDGIDVVLSGHTHNRLLEPIKENGALIIQSGCHGSFIGRLDLEIEGGRIINHRHELIPVDQKLSEDRHVARLVAEAVASQPDEMAGVVGSVAAPLHRYSQLSAPMDDLLLEAVAAAAGTEVAFSNGWRYGAPIPPGPVTVENLWNIIPVNPPVSSVSLTGAELVEMIERNLESTFAADPFLQMGGYVKRMRGLTLYVKIENPFGNRIDRLFVGDNLVEPDEVYRVAFVTSQGVPPGYGHDRRNLEIDAITALQNLFAQTGTVQPPSEATVLAV